MKNKRMLILSGAVIVVMVILSIFYPPVNENETAGTIGKVDKYRNSTTSEKDIVLRNEVLQDTAVLAQTIATLQIYESYLNGLSSNFAEWETEIKNLNLDNSKLESQLDQLNLLTQFMNNNLTAVSSTRELLNKYYTKDTSEITIDIENNLIQFGDFVNNLSEKDKVLDSLFVSLDGMIDKSDLEILKDTKGKTEDLVTIREKMLGTLAFHAAMMGNESRLNMALSSSILDAVVLHNQLKSQLGMIYPAKTVNVKTGKEQLNNVLFSKEAVFGFWGKVDAASAKQAASLENLPLNASLKGVLHGKELGAILNKENLGFFAKKDGNNAVYHFKAYNSSASLGSYAWGKASLGPAASTFARALGPIGAFAKTLGSKDALGFNLH